MEDHCRGIESILNKGTYGEVYNIGGIAYSLDSIEKKTLVPLVTFNNGGIDARIHFAVICAANGWVASTTWVMLSAFR